MKPNILWFCTDQQRFDTIAALGNEHITTPNIDALVARGVAFTNAYCQSPICTPSRASFLTGKYPSSTHVYRNGNKRFPSGETLVTKLFADAGYDCGLIGKLHLSAASKLEVRPDDGYRVFHWSHHPTPDYPAGHDYAHWLEDEKGVSPESVYSGITNFCGAGVPEEHHQTTWCAERAIDFISEERDPDQPWLLSVNCFDPHPPFDPPANYLDRYRAEDLPHPAFRPEDIPRNAKFEKVDQQSKIAIDPINCHSSQDDIPLADRKARAYEPPLEFNGREVKAAYYAMIELIDHQFGRIVRSLEETGQLDNTIIVFMSDHGEMLGDHGLIYKGCRFFEGLVHVPLIISWPQKFSENLKSEGLVELVDVAPTLLDAAGLDIPSCFQGNSLMPVLTGQADASIIRDHVICEYRDSVAMPNASNGSMYFDGRYKIIVYHGLGIGELYDLASDPDEFDDLWDNPANKENRDRLMHLHFDAMMASISPGPERIEKY
ncbi:sulfatase [Pararhizobium sp. IMCC21322]|uniref:sulfatase family protein n=1 Tax=Pararhizobium sp. IMCC21322 TaxID=3067903 RepID=UPI0027404D25|nr:sulfatase-like hydrolase/transferase [Pararhizobium sp. IMCC21322]